VIKPAFSTRLFYEAVGVVLRRGFAKQLSAPKGYREAQIQGSHVRTENLGTRLKIGLTKHAPVKIVTLALVDTYNGIHIESALPLRAIRELRHGVLQRASLCCEYIMQGRNSGNL
jgi:hypothetical protein